MQGHSPSNAPLLDSLSSREGRSNSNISRSGNIPSSPKPGSALRHAPNGVAASRVNHTSSSDQRFPTSNGKSKRKSLYLAVPDKEISQDSCTSSTLDSDTPMMASSLA